MATSDIPDVLASCNRVVDLASQVAIDTHALQAWARDLAAEFDAGPSANQLLAISSDADAVANFVLLVDALNFCFWSDAGWEVEYDGKVWTRTLAMEASLRRLMTEDSSWLDPGRWAVVSRSQVEHVFRGQGSIPLLDRRVEVMRETGQVLSEKFAGRCRNLVKDAEYDALILSRLIARQFPSFRDVAEFAGQPVALLKRAQIFAADLHRTWIAIGQAGLDNMESLTVFADYRLPQLFRHRGVLELDPALAARIDRGELIEAGSDDEVALRAATVVIGDRLCAAISDLGRSAPAWQIDYHLWEMARRPDVTTPHHRTVTIFY